MLLSHSAGQTTPLVNLPVVVVLAAPHKVSPPLADPVVNPPNDTGQNGTTGQVLIVPSAVNESTGAGGSPDNTPQVATTPSPGFSIEYIYNNNLTLSSYEAVATTNGPILGPSPKTGNSGNNDEQSEPTPEGMQQLPLVAMADDVEVSGTLQPAQYWMTYKIPVESRTQSLRVTISELGPQQGPAFPALDQCYLVGPSGAILTMLQGAAQYAKGPRQDMMIFLTSVPDNSMLLVRIVETPAQTLAAKPPQAVPTQNLPFIMDIQRSDVAVGTLPSIAEFQSVAVTGLTGSLLIPFSDFATATFSLSLAVSGADHDMEVAGSELTAVASSAFEFVAAGPWLTTQVETTGLGISVGPLVSRGSAPLRPLLGTTAGEPTPPIDRYERAYDLAALESGGVVDAELLLSLTTNRSDGKGEDLPVDQEVSTPATLLALRGPGGLRMMVSARSAGQSLIDPAAVLATLTMPEKLPDTARQLAGLRVPPMIDFDYDFQADDSCQIGLLKSACAFMLAIGPTIGPFYPDLMVLVRSGLPHRLPLASSPGRSCAPPGDSLHRYRRLLGLCR